MIDPPTHSQHCNHCCLRSSSSSPAEEKNQRVKSTKPLENQNCTPKEPRQATAETPGWAITPQISHGLQPRNQLSDGAAIRNEKLMMDGEVLVGCTDHFFPEQRGVLFGILTCDEETEDSTVLEAHTAHRAPPPAAPAARRAPASQRRAARTGGGRGVCQAARWWG